MCYEQTIINYFKNDKKKIYNYITVMTLYLSINNYNIYDAYLNTYKLLLW